MVHFHSYSTCQRQYKVQEGLVALEVQEEGEGLVWVGVLLLKSILALNSPHFNHVHTEAHRTMLEEPSAQQINPIRPLKHSSLRSIALSQHCSRSHSHPSLFSTIPNILPCQFLHQCNIQRNIPGPYILHFHLCQHNIPGLHTLWFLLGHLHHSYLP
ncbi:hypothetical protein SERLADRAFT_405674 [Serpula lacrymans var. lacrymans S7.9]|uniref:Uncharacterized protein n=1 Tax=Serpula lacrymans var. lacrymans (strain S7.9) TaxID=578457 RepID=F8NJC2_SERL9|nr:uncharacterized protein SERLADRAFT_405674 [Serpula lacrymans var. lacrymans S7.9]EGO29820.1 hypothetical protein SERLADRAFT_405674 [Serpula lacrymans var. lacrymans S7.9]